MTDKEIIIDDVDISGCEYCLKMTKYRCTIQRDVYKCLCEENPNCHYKQLKRSEAQCEAMFVSHTDLEKKYKAKEQECEELKAEIKHYKQIAQYHGNLSVKYTNKSAKYKQTLTEIRKIVEKQVKRAPDGETFARPEIKQILQKISEVNNDR